MFIKVINFNSMFNSEPLNAHLTILIPQQSVKLKVKEIKLPKRHLLTQTKWLFSSHWVFKFHLSICVVYKITIIKPWQATTYNHNIHYYDLFLYKANMNICSLSINEPIQLLWCRVFSKCETPNTGVGVRENEKMKIERSNCGP